MINCISSIISGVKGISSTSSSWKSLSISLSSLGTPGWFPNWFNGSNFCSCNLIPISWKISCKLILRFISGVFSSFSILYLIIVSCLDSSLFIGCDSEGLISTTGSCSIGLVTWLIDSSVSTSDWKIKNSVKNKFMNLLKTYGYCGRLIAIIRLFFLVNWIC